MAVKPELVLPQVLSILPYTGSRYNGHETGSNRISDFGRGIGEILATFHVQWRQILVFAMSPFYRNDQYGDE